MSIKIDRISSEVAKVLSSILLMEAKNEILKIVNITDCQVTNDLSFADIYYTYMGDVDKEVVQTELENSEKYLRTVLASKIELRHTPELRFFYDNSIEYGQNIERIINKLHESEKNDNNN